MAQKIYLTLEVDDSQLNAAQAKADKLVETLKQAEKLLHEIVTPKSPFNFDTYKTTPEPHKFKFGAPQWTINL